MTIRPAAAADIDAVLELWAVGRTAHAVSADGREDVERLLAHGRSALLVAEEEGAIVGAVIAGNDGWRGSFARLAVHPDRRRRGIGLALVRAGEEHLRAEGIFRVTVLLAHEDAGAGGFWLAAGYPFDPDIVRHVRNL